MAHRVAIAVVALLVPRCAFPDGPVPKPAGVEIAAGETKIVLPHPFVSAIHLGGAFDGIEEFSLGSDEKSVARAEALGWSCWRAYSDQGLYGCRYAETDQRIALEFVAGRIAWMQLFVNAEWSTACPLFDKLVKAVRESLGVPVLASTQMKCDPASRLEWNREVWQLPHGSAVIVDFKTTHARDSVGIVLCPKDATGVNKQTDRTPRTPCTLNRRTPAVIGWPTPPPPR